MADIIISIASKVAEYLVAPIGRQLGYLFNYHSNLNDLKIKLDELNVVRGRMERSINAARRNGEEIEPDVEKWLKSVNEITEKAGEILPKDEDKRNDVKDEVKQDVDDSTRSGEEIKPGVEKWLRSVDGITKKAGEDEDKAKKRCLNGLCPNLKSRYQLSKKAKKTAEEVVKIQDGGKFERVSNRPTPQGTIGSAPIKGYEDFESRMSTFKEIMEALRNPNINMIGVYGMGGVGKTMLVKEVARKAKEDKLFDEVVMAVVSQPPNIRKIQEEIAYPLGLRFNAQEIDSERVDRLCGRLKQEKNILIILDDIWAQLDLEAIGIPSGDIHKGCKIVVTSRRLDLLSNQMNAQKNFEIGQLLKEEAWNLFKKMAGDSVEAPEIKPTALKVAKECAGLPIAVAVVATALKNKSLSVWKNALHQLETAAPTTIEGMHAKVYSSLKLSYDFIESDAQKLFLLCSLLPEDYQFSIQELLYYGKGVGLFQGIEALEKARDSVHALIDHLKASCLLLDGKTSGLFKMHDVVRDVGIYVASKDKHMSIVRNSAELEEWMIGEQLKSCSAISLPYIDIHELPTGFESPALKFFLFFSSLHVYSKILDSFFVGMKQLKVLTLRNIYFSSLHLPSSLQTLCLDSCQLEDISIIGELKKLEILSFRHSKMKELPREIGQFTRLKLLDLRDCEELEVILPNVIASLSQLEELYMRESFNRWEVDGNASLAELKHLSRLVTLEIYIPDPNILPNDFVFEKLTRYRICIGDIRDWSDDYEISRTLNLAVNTSIQLLSGINKLLKRTEDLQLEELNGFKSILNDSDGEGFHDTKHLHVKSSSEIEYVVDTSVLFSAFPKLESLSLLRLINLKEICHGQLTVESFSNLRKVEVIDCDRLQNLFPLSVARRLSKLQKIQIWNCKNMDGIVAEGREAAEDNNGAVFPQLWSLKLRVLPELVRFCSKVKAVPCTSDAGPKEIISISEDEHGISIPLFNEKDIFPNLEILDIASISMKEIWHFQLPDGSFCKLKHLEVKNCFHLSNIVPSNMLAMLQNMESMLVDRCGDYLEYIFDVGGINHTESRHVGRTSCELRDLYLSELPGLITIWKNDSPGVFPLEKLSSLKVSSCPHLKNIFTSFRAKSLVQLQEVNIEYCDEMEEIVGKEGVDEEEATSKIVFPQVTSLNLAGLPQLKSFCQGIRMSEWPFLKTLYVSSCDNVEILASELRSFKETCGKVFFLVDKVAFPNLEELDLQDLPRLMAVWMKDSRGSLNFQKLSSLCICNCESLINVFTTSMVEEIIEKEEEAAVAAIDKIMFPQVKSLTLECLKQFMSFCQWIHISEWPSLKKLKMFNCHNVEIFASELSTFKETRGKANLGTPTKQPLFLVDKVAFPNLEVMELNDMSSMEVIWQGQFYAHSFCKLRVLKVEKCDKILKVFPISLLRNLQYLEELSVKDCCSLEHVFELGGVGETEQFQAHSFCKLRVLNVEKCDKILKVFPISLLRNLHNLEELSVKDCCSLEDVFELEGGVGETEHASTFPPLTDLMLIGLPKLMHLWKEDSQLSAVFQNLTFLEVRSCGSLTHVFPSTRVEGPLKIEIKTVVGDKGEAMDEMTFSQLYYLKLKDLPNLTSFCPGGNNLSFPSLKWVVVEECLKLKTFSTNTLRTPKLEKVQVKEDEWDWETNEWLWDGDLNSTIQHLFKQKAEEGAEDAEED